MGSKTTWLCAISSLLLLTLGVSVTSAQDSANYPSKVITMQVPFSAGGSTDVMGRVFADMIAAELGGNIIVENLAGAGGVTGTIKVAGDAADGYSLLLGTPGPVVIQPLRDPKLGYDLWTAFDPVSMLWSQPMALLVRKDRFPTVESFIEQAAERPGEITYGSAGNGSFNHVAGAYFESVVGVQLLHIPYKGIAEAVTDTLAGHIDAAFVTAASLAGMAEELQGLFVSTDKRVPSLPNVPSADEVGLSNYKLSNFGILLAPKGTPPEVIAKLNAALGKAFAVQENAKKIENFNVVLNLEHDPESIKAFIAAQTEIARNAVQAAK